MIKRDFSKTGVVFYVYGTVNLRLWYYEHVFTVP